MIRIKENLKEPVVDLWYNVKDGKGEYVGKIVNQIQFLDVRLQIKEQQLSGYSVYYKGQQIRIDKYGTLEDNPDGLYDQSIDILMKLL